MIDNEDDIVHLPHPLGGEVRSLRGGTGRDGGTAQGQGRGDRVRRCRGEEVVAGGGGGGIEDDGEVGGGLVGVTRIACS